MAILPDLSFTTITPNPNNTAQLTFGIARAGTLRVESSEDLLVWKLVQSQTTTGGSVTVTDTSVPSRARFYRAVLQ